MKLGHALILHVLGSVLCRCDMPKFTVDTHLFRELGELLVGRDSTALVELVKNSYDADATHVQVYGESLDTPENGFIIIRDDGVGMNSRQFEEGFLRVASRIKSHGDPRSPRFGRRYTGAKGIGRLAAHKLARYIAIESFPWTSTGDDAEPIDARIDWDIVEAHQNLDELEDSDAITLAPRASAEGSQRGTTITLSRLRRRWTSSERSRFFTEVTSFTPPEQLVNLPDGVTDEDLLFLTPRICDTTSKDPGFTVELHGELQAGEDYWVALAQTADWLIEIDASRDHDGAPAGACKVRYKVTPTKLTRKDLRSARSRFFEMDHPSADDGPFFQARILIREGHLAEQGLDTGWLTKSNGVRVFMEGFRVLPYGEPGNDWLEIDRGYSRRQRQLAFLKDLPVGVPMDEDEGLMALRNANYFGAVFLTEEDAPGLQMLVNREGFIPEASYETLCTLVRIGIDLSTRVRAYFGREHRELWRLEREIQPEIEVEPVRRLELREQIEASVRRAAEFAQQARIQAAEGDFGSAIEYIDQAAEEFALTSEASERLMTERALTQVLAAVGLQMAAFVHEINALLGMANTLQVALEAISRDRALPASARTRIGQLVGSVGDLRRAIERQASYLVDVVSADARRRRSRQRMAERFDASRRLVQTSADRRGIEIVNDIPSDFRTPPMFPAEVTVIFTNLLTNAVKAAGDNGRIHASGVRDGAVLRIRVENTGAAVPSSEGERWFRPLESTTTEIDPFLGQGMGMGLPITRNVLAEYGATARFVEPSHGYATAVELTFKE